MKKVIALMLAVMLVGATLLYTPKTADAKVFNVKVTSQMNSIKLKWSKVKKASYYEVYRFTSKTYDRYISKSKYKKIATTGKRKYVDKSVKKKKYYAYFVKAKNSRGKVVAKNFEEYADYYCKGLDEVGLSKDSYDDAFHNDHKNIHLNIIEGSRGYLPKNIKYQVFRKEIGSKKFIKVKSKKLKDSWVDQSVEPMKSYTYKVRSYVKKGKKTYYSKFSNTVTMKAVDYTADFDVRCLTPSGEYIGPSMEVNLRIKKTNKYAEDVYLFKAIGDYYAIEKGKENDSYNCYSFAVSDYSLDKSNWNVISEKGLKLEYGKEYYIRGYIIAIDNKVVFAGSNNTKYAESIIGGESLMDYKLKGNNSTYTKLKLHENKGQAGNIEY